MRNLKHLSSCSGLCLCATRRRSARLKHAENKYTSRTPHPGLNDADDCKGVPISITPHLGNRQQRALGTDAVGCCRQGCAPGRRSLAGDKRSDDLSRNEFPVFASPHKEAKTDCFTPGIHSLQKRKKQLSSQHTKKTSSAPEAVLDHHAPRVLPLALQHARDVALRVRDVVGGHHREVPLLELPLRLSARGSGVALRMILVCILQGNFFRPLNDAI